MHLWVLPICFPSPPINLSGGPVQISMLLGPYRSGDPHPPSTMLHEICSAEERHYAETALPRRKGIEESNFPILAPTLLYFPAYDRCSLNHVLQAWSPLFDHAKATFWLVIIYLSETTSSISSSPTFLTSPFILLFITRHFHCFDLFYLP
jgi:hypothetical protein